MIGWGGPQTSTCVAIGWLAIVTYCKTKGSTWDKIILISGTKDTRIVLDAKRPIFSQVRAKHQGHTCILDGDTPGLGFKREGKLIATRLPPKFLRSFRDSCPLCLAMKRRRNPRPKSSMLGQNELAHWQEAYCDRSGKFRTVSKAKNRYVTLFVCAKSGGKVFIAHRNKKHFPVVFLKVIQRIGRHPQVLYSDKRGGIDFKAATTLVHCSSCLSHCYSLWRTPLYWCRREGNKTFSTFLNV